MGTYPSPEDENLDKLQWGIFLLVVAVLSSAAWKILGAIC